MPPRLLLHIGTTKTGSSSIQEALKGAAEGLLGLGVRYPTDVKNHLSLGRHWLKEPRAMQTSRRLLAEARRALASGEVRQVLFSSELLVRLPEEGIRALIDAVGVSPDEVYAICYVRRPSGYWLSQTQQRVRIHASFQPLSARYRFRERLARWGAVIPNLDVRPFERAQLQGGDAVLDFVARALLPNVPGAEALPWRPGLSANTGFSVEAAVLMRQLREVGFAELEGVRTRASMLLAKHLRERGHEGFTKPRLDPEVARLIDEAHGEDLRWLQDTHGVRFTGLEPAAPEVAAEARAALEASPRGFEDVVQASAPEQVHRLALELICQLAEAAVAGQPPPQ